MTGGGETPTVPRTTPSVKPKTAVPPVATPSITNANQIASSAEEEEEEGEEMYDEDGEDEVIEVPAPVRHIPPVRTFPRSSAFE